MKWRLHNLNAIVGAKTLFCNFTRYILSNKCLKMHKSVWPGFYQMLKPKRVVERNPVAKLWCGSTIRRVSTNLDLPYAHHYNKAWWSYLEKRRRKTYEKNRTVNKRYIPYVRVFLCPTPWYKNKPKTSAAMHYGRCMLWDPT